MDQMAGIILTEDNEANMGTLTEQRAISAIPLGGRYRIIDFILSCMVNSGIRNVGVATQHNYQSLMDHLGSGKGWDLSRKNSGLYLLPPNVNRHSTGAPGDIDILYGASSFIRKTKPEYIVITRGNTIYNMTFNEVLEYHQAKGADITVIYNREKNADPKSLSRYTLLETAPDGRVTDIVKNHPNPEYDKVSMEAYIIERSLLINLIENSVARGLHDFVMDGLIKHLGELKIYGYEFGGYVGRIDNVSNYFSINMNFLDPDIRRELFSAKTKIYTKVKDQVPTHYGDNAKVVDSLVADGCEIDGTVENSVIFRGVRIGKGTVIKNSIIMQNSVIEENCYAENVVIDKEVIMTPDKKLIGQPSYPYVVEKGKVI